MLSKRPQRRRPTPRRCRRRHYRGGSLGVPNQYWINAIYRQSATTIKPQRRKAEYMSLQELVQSFPGANRKMRVYPNQSTLCSTTCRAEGAKKKLRTFLKM